MKRIKSSLKIIAILSAIFFLLSCDNTLRDEDKSSSFLLLVRIKGEAVDGGEADFYESDVQDDETGVVYEDVSVATLEAKLKEPLSLIGPSYKNSIVVTRYTIVYTAVDPPTSSVPQSFEGHLTAVIEIDATTDVSFILVKATAKNESPLQEIKDAVNSLVVRATITFYGHDLASNPVQASGDITIHFADWVNE